MVDARAVIEAVAAEHGITYEVIVGPSTRPIHYEPRQEAMRRLHELGLGARQVGKLLNRSIPTVTYGIRRAHARLPRSEKQPLESAPRPTGVQTPREVIQRLIREAAIKHRVPVLALSNTRNASRRVVEARWEAARAIKHEFPSWSQARVAKAIGCHYSTVGYAMNPERRAKKRTYPDHQQFREPDGRSGAETNSEHGYSASIGAAE